MIIRWTFELVRTIRTGSSLPMLQLQEMGLVTLQAGSLSRNSALGAAAARSAALLSSDVVRSLLEGGPLHLTARSPTDARAD